MGLICGLGTWETKEGLYTSWGQKGRKESSSVLIANEMVGQTSGLQTCSSSVVVEHTNLRSGLSAQSYLKCGGGTH